MGKKKMGNLITPGKNLIPPFASGRKASQENWDKAFNGSGPKLNIMSKEDREKRNLDKE
jgi:hypothetical protein